MRSPQTLWQVVLTAGWLIISVMSSSDLLKRSVNSILASPDANPAATTTTTAVSGEVFKRDLLPRKPDDWHKGQYLYGRPVSHYCGVEPERVWRGDGCLPFGIHGDRTWARYCAPTLGASPRILDGSYVYACPLTTYCKPTEEFKHPLFPYTSAKIRSVECHLKGVTGLTNNLFGRMRGLVRSASSSSYSRFEEGSSSSSSSSSSRSRGASSSNGGSDTYRHRPAMVELNRIGEDDADADDDDHQGLLDHSNDPRSRSGYTGVGVTIHKGFKDWRDPSRGHR